MTGEIEEPFRMNFQADLLHSGSISFGRFESESLSWERRSVFSTNKYLEEVEKYSKPGSVTEKKAYFEAEFRRKALLKQRSSECQDEGEFPTSRNNDLRDLEVSGNDNESPCSSNPSESNGEFNTEHHEKGDIEALYENGNVNTNVACFDESSQNSGYDEESQETINLKCESKTFEFLPIATQDEPVNYTMERAVDVPTHLKLDETQHSDTKNLVGITEQSIGVIIIDKIVPVEVTSEANDSSHTCQTPDKSHDRRRSSPQTTCSPKVKLVSEKKLTRATLKTQTNVDRFHKQLSNESSKGLLKPRASESKYLLVKKQEKTPRPASPFSHSGVKTLKSEDATSNKEKEVRLKKSNFKDPRSEKGVLAHFPLSEKTITTVRSSVNRLKPTVNSSKPQSASGFSLKTDQRAENRKEFYTKITDKIHAKEAVINQVEAKTLEKQAAEMKQFRRSLNFKAKPMPSFYNESARGSSQRKATPISKTPNQPRPSSQSMATRHDKNSFKSCVPSNIRRPSSSTSSTNRIRLSESVRRIHVPEKNEEQKKKDANSKKQQETEPRGRDMARKHGS